MTEEQLAYVMDENPEIKRLWAKVTMRLGMNSLIRLLTDDEKYNVWVTDMDILRNALRPHNKIDDDRERF